MADLNQIVRMLEAQRRELQDQLDAVDRAIAALGAPRPAAAPRSAERDRAATSDVAEAGTEAAAMRPTRVKARRALTDAHKHALMAGKRRARAAHDVAKGIAREQPDDGFVPAIGTRSDRHAPRLVKAPGKK